MKKLMSFLLILSLLCGVSAFTAAGEAAKAPKPEEYTSGDFMYIVLEDGTAEITRYVGTDEELSIPEELDGKKVTSIREGILSLFSSLTSVTIPDSVIRIDANPFEGCITLTDIIVSPDHPCLETIDGVLFSKPDKRLVCYPRAFTADSYIIPEGTQIIGVGAFYVCSSLTSVTIPDSVTGIEARAFFSCDLPSVTIPDSVTSIGNSAFSSCRSLASVTIPGGGTSIGEATFAGCTSLTSVTIPGGVTSIGEATFAGCTSLTSVTILDGVTSIGSRAFSGCFALASVSIPDSVTGIVDRAFFGCDSLTLTVSRDSYAEQYCKDNGLKYTYPDALDRLNN